MFFHSNPTSFKRIIYTKLNEAWLIENSPKVLFIARCSAVVYLITAFFLLFFTCMLVSFGFQLSNLGIMTARLLPALQECFKSEYVSVRIEAAVVSSSRNDCTPLTASIFQKTVEFLRVMGVPVERLAYFPNPFANFHAFSKSLSRRFGFFFQCSFSLAH